MTSEGVIFEPYSVLVVGAGSIGRRHMDNLRKLGVRRLAAVDSDASRLQHAAQEFGTENYADLREALVRAQPDVVFVCTPPVFHVQNALDSLQRGADVFIEKPLAHVLDGVQELKLEAERRKRVAHVGYNLRFHPAIRTLKKCVEGGAIGRIVWARAEVAQYLPNWRPWQDYRQSYTGRRDLGGGIILDASHEIDYLLWLLGPPVELTCMAGKVSNLDVDVEDCATILMRLPSCAQVEVHMDFVQRAQTRSVVLAGEQGTLRWDSADNEVRILRPEGAVERVPHEFEVNRMYVAEVEHFFACVRDREVANSGLADAETALRVARAALTSSAERRWVSFEQ